MQFAQHIENSPALKKQLEEIHGRIEEASRMIRAIDSEPNDGSARVYWQSRLEAANKQWDRLYPTE